LYVVSKDLNNNTITVSETINKTSYNKKSFEIKNINWISEVPKKNKKYTAQIRYHGEQLPCKVENNLVIFDKAILISPGQSIVVYDRDMCIGGGVVI
jgi:tRNA-specific 2-thiouridylase